MLMGIYTKANTLAQHWLRLRSGQGDTGLNENAEYYNAGTDGVLTILGEKLEVEEE